MSGKFIPVLLSGGAGSRLWPLSREDDPKPFMKMSDNQSLLQKTYLRAKSVAEDNLILTVTNREYYFRTRDEFDSVLSNQGNLNIENLYLLEPVGRNTAPAIAMAALMLQEKFHGDVVMLVLSADHLIEGEEEFKASVSIARQLVEKGYFSTFGISPTRPETGYGYIHLGAKVSDVDSSYLIESFIEKPTFDAAKAYVESGQYYWNAGLFCFSSNQLLDAMKETCPNIYDLALECWERTKVLSCGSVCEIDKESFVNVPNISIDYAVMEKIKNGAVIKAEFEWSDVGSWDTVSEFSEADILGNRVEGNAVLMDTHDTFVHTSGRTVAAVGVSNLIIVDTEDAVLISDKSKTQDIKKVVEHLRRTNNATYKSHKTSVRPWGEMAVLESKEKFNISQMIIKSGKIYTGVGTSGDALINGVIACGQAMLIYGELAFQLFSGQSYSIPRGVSYSIENTGFSLLTVIEVSIK